MSFEAQGGQLDDVKYRCDHSCKKCGQKTVTYQEWDSNCGGYTDFKYTCQCGHSWWVDGIDS